MMDRGKVAAAGVARRMRIDQALKSGTSAVSFEFFPPKSEEVFRSLYKTIDDLHPLDPSYVSVTYGAGGSTRAKTVELVTKIQTDLKLRSMAHLTCVGHTADEIGSIPDDLWNAGLPSVPALRGDPPAPQPACV